jgi:hypothetical protein
MRTHVAWIALAAILALAPGRARAAESDPWEAYLDYAYVYSSADAAELRTRLAEYGREAHRPLQQFVTERYEAAAHRDGPLDEVAVRREAIAHLLLYLSEGEPEELEKSVDTVQKLEDRLGRHENRYWYRYIRAHRALEKGRRFDFVGEVLDLWREVVVPLETPYETLQTLSLDESPHSGFASALPYIYENVARLVLLRSPKMGVDRDLDPLGAIVRMLDDGRVGAQPDVIPLETSSKDYLDRVVARLEGPESDGGSLTFTLALFEAAKYHDEARGLLAKEGLSDATLRAMRVTSGAYQAALDRAMTLQGECAVQTRVLRMLGELYAARRRLGVDPEIETPFSIEGAIDVYARMARAREGEGFREIGYAKAGRAAYVEAMRALWEEIQEATLNAADYYLARAVAAPHLADENSRNAARLFERYLAFFSKYATAEGKEGVPESAYFAAHEAARGVGDAFLLYAAHPKTSEIDLAVRRYRAALRLFPFDRTVWAALTPALERQGRESEYVELVRPAAEAVTRSRSVHTWIENNEPEAKRIAILTRAFGDSLALVYLGFADGSGVAELEKSLEELKQRRGQVDARLAELRAQRDGAVAPPASPSPDADGSVGAPPPLDAAALSELNRSLAEQSELRDRIDKQIEARTRALPLYKATLGTDGLADELRARRDHPVHVLLRRLYHESRQEGRSEQ